MTEDKELIEGMERAYGIVSALSRPTRSELGLATLLGAGAVRLRTLVEENERLDTGLRARGHSVR